MPLIARRGGALGGEARVPGDKSISHRALMLAAVAVGETRISGLLEGEDILATAAAIQALGAEAHRDGAGAWRVRGLGVGGLREPDGVLDLGNSGTGVRLLMGILAAHPMTATLTGDASLVSRPMGRVAEPLALMGADIRARDGGRLPLTITGSDLLRPVSYRLPVPSAQVKSAVLLAGLGAPGVTEVIEAAPAGAFDLVAACSGFVYGVNIADSLIRSGRHRAIAVVGCDAMSTAVDFTERSVSILFGDAAGALVLTRDEDPNLGCLYQTLQADGSLWKSLYMPRREKEVPASDGDCPIRLGCLRMNGREIFRFAVTKFREVLEDALDGSGLTVDEVSQFVVHQSNVRIIDAAKKKLGLPDDKVYVNIDRYGNTSAASIPIALDECVREGRVKKGSNVLMVAFGGGFTWGSTLVRW